MCKIADTSRVSVSLRNMELIAAGQVAQFEITVDGTSNSELAVAVKGTTLPSLFFFFTDFPFLAVAGILVSFNRCHHRRLVTIFFSRSQLFLIGGILLHDVQLHRATPLGGNGPLDREPYIPGRRVVLRTTAAADGFDDNSLIGGREGPTANLPVKIAGGARNTFVAEFVPREVGTHTISVDYNGLPVTGTPFTCKVYDAAKVYVSAMPAGVLGKSLQFTGQSTILIRIVADDR